MHQILPIMTGCLILGLALGFGLALPGFICLPAGLALALATLQLRGRPLPWLGALTGSLILAGFSLAASVWETPRAPCRPVRHAGNRLVRLVGTVIGHGRPTSRGERFVLEAGLLLRGQQAIPLCGRVELFRPAAGAPLHRGERVLVRGKLKAVTGSRNPGSISAGLRLPGNGPAARLWTSAEDLVILTRRAPSITGIARRGIQGRLARAVKDRDQRAILSALVAGDKSGLSPGQRLAFARAGTSHLLAISGLHLAMVALGIIWASRRILLLCPNLCRGIDPGRLAVLPGILAAVSYTLLTGASAPTVRACVLILCLGLARLGDRPPDLWRPLSMAALFLLLHDPVNLLRPGFQLSFIAVIGIALAARPMAAGDGPPGGIRIMARWLKGLAMASLAATLVTMPLVAHHFAQVTLAGLVINLLAIPWTSFVLLPTALAGSVLAAAWPGPGGLLLELAGHAAGTLDQLCRTAADWPVHWHVPSPGWVLTLLLTALALGLLLQAKARRLVLTGTCALLIIFLIVSAATAPAPHLELTFLDVGQGDSTFVALPDGYTILVDGGGDPAGRADPGRTRVLPFLRARGVRRLNLVVATHPHPDHTAGLESVLNEMEVEEVWLCWHKEPNPWHQRLMDVARRRHVKVSPPRDLVRGPFALRPLWPAGHEGQCADPGRSANNNSVVLLLEMGRAAALLPGDIEREVEAALVQGAGRRLRADLLKAPHHGSGTSSTPGFLDAVAPRLALISCGLDNSFGIPPPHILERYHGRGIPLARVDREGAIGVRLFPDGTLLWTPLTGPGPRRWRMANPRQKGK